MKRYSVWMDVTETWKVYFEAEGLEQAKQIISDLEHGDIEADSVRGYFEKNKGIESAYALDTLEEEGEVN